MPAGCRREGFDVETAIVYRAEPRARLAKVAEAALKDGTADGVLLYSRRSAAAFALALRAGGLAPLGEERHLLLPFGGLRRAARQSHGRAVSASRNGRTSSRFSP